MFDPHVNVRVNLEEAAREIGEVIREMEFKKCAEHVTALADCVLQIAVATSGSITTAATKLFEMAEAIRSAAAGSPESNIFYALRETIAQVGSNLDTFLKAATRATSQIQPGIVDTLIIVRRAVTVFSALSTLSSVGTMLANLYSSSEERQLQQQRFSLELNMATLEYIKTCFGDKPQAIATTHALMAKAETDRIKEQRVCPPGYEVMNVFVGGQLSVLAHIHALRRDPDMDTLFPPGFVGSTTLPEALAAAESYLTQGDLEKRKCTFFVFHFALALPSLDCRLPRLLRLDPIHVGPHVTEQGFALVAGNFPGQSQIAVSVNSTIMRPDGSTAPLCIHVLPSRLCNILYHGPGYGLGIFGQVRNAVEGTAGVCILGVTAEGAKLKLGPYGLVKALTGKCIAVKFGFAVSAGGPLAMGTTLIGYDHWCKHWKDHVQTPDQLWKTLGLYPEV